MEEACREVQWSEEASPVTLSNLSPLTNLITTTTTTTIVFIFVTTATTTTNITTSPSTPSTSLLGSLNWLIHRGARSCHAEKRRLCCFCVFSCSCH